MKNLFISRNHPSLGTYIGDFHGDLRDFSVVISVQANGIFCLIMVNALKFRTPDVFA